MGKGSRNRGHKETEVVSVPKANGKKVKAVIISGVAICLCVVIFFVFALSNGIFYRNTKAMESENYDVSVAMASYFFEDCCNQELAENGEYYYYYHGFDMDKPYSEQYIDEEKSTSFLTYFRDMTKDYIGEILIYSEAARARGEKLNNEDIKNIDDDIAAMKQIAAQKGVSFNKYLKQTYGAGVREKDVRACLELTIMADKEYKYVEESFSPTEKEIADFYKENSKAINTASYIYYTFNGSTAKKRAAELKGCKTEGAFCKYIVDFMLDSSLESSRQSAEKALEEYKVSDKAYTSGDDLSNWLFKEGRKEGDTIILNDQSGSTVYYVTEPPHRNENRSANVRHILLSKSKYSNISAAKQKGKEILNEWKQGGGTVELFEELCEKYSEDEDTATLGGLYENHIEGGVENAYEFDEWCFDSRRKAGDTEILSAEYGVHIMYFESFGLEVWKLNCMDYMLEETVNSAHNKYYEQHVVTTTDNAFNNIKR